MMREFFSDWFSVAVVAALLLALANLIFVFVVAATIPSC